MNSYTSFETQRRCPSSGTTPIRVLTSAHREPGLTFPSRKAEGQPSSELGGGRGAGKGGEGSRGGRDCSLGGKGCLVPGGGLECPGRAGVLAQSARWDHRPSALLMASVPTEPVRPPLEAAVPGGHAARMLPQGPGDVRGLAGSTLLSLSGGRQSEHEVPGAGGRPCCPGCPAPGWRQAAQRPPASVSSAPGLRRAEVSDVIRGLRLSIPASGA